MIYDILRCLTEINVLADYFPANRLVIHGLGYHGILGSQYLEEKESNISNERHCNPRSDLQSLKVNVMNHTEFSFHRTQNNWEFT
jgi:hypothetical protein